MHGHGVSEGLLCKWLLLAFYGVKWVLLGWDKGLTLAVEYVYDCRRFHVF
jgi:hypothetical protein